MIGRPVVPLQGPLEALGPDYSIWVASQPWSAGTARHAWRALVGLSRWLEAQRIELGDVDEDVVDLHVASARARVAYSDG